MEHCKCLNRDTFFFGLIIVLFLSCSSGKIPKSVNILTTKNAGDSYTKQHFRKGWMFVDSIQSKQIIERKVYLNGSLMYRFPIRKSELAKSDIQLQSGNNYLSSGIPDTLSFKNVNLPVMNRHLYTTGGTISKISDSSYLIKSVGTSRNVVFYVSVSANLDEINNSEQFISDSLVLPVR